RRRNGEKIWNAREITELPAEQDQKYEQYRKEWQYQQVAVQQGAVPQHRNKEGRTRCQITRRRQYAARWVPGQVGAEGGSRLLRFLDPASSASRMPRLNMPARQSADGVKS